MIKRETIIPYGDWLHCNLSGYSKGAFNGLPLLVEDIKSHRYEVKVDYPQFNYSTIESRTINNITISKHDVYNLGKLYTLTCGGLKMKPRKTYFSRKEILCGSEQSSYSTFANLAHWGLIKALDKKTKIKNSEGKWSITPTGIRFCIKGKKVPKYYFTKSGSNSGPIAYQGPLIGINEVSNFDEKTWQGIVGII